MMAIRNRQTGTAERLLELAFACTWQTRCFQSRN